MYRPGSRKWWRGIELLYRRVERDTWLAEGKEVGGSCSRQLLSWRAPIFSIPKPAVTGFEMKSPDENPGDQVIRDRRNKDITEDEGR